MTRTIKMTVEYEAAPDALGAVLERHAAGEEGPLAGLIPNTVKMVHARVEENPDWEPIAPVQETWDDDTPSERLIERAERAERAAQTLSKVIEDQCRDIARITRSEHLVDEDGDADWGAIWERGHDMAQRLEDAEARIDELRDQVGRAVREKDEWEANAGDAEARVEKAEQEQDEARKHLHDAEARIDKLRAEQPRPLSADDITDEARERAHRAVAALSVSDWDDLSGVAKGRAMALVEAVITEVTRPEPQRPEGAEELDELIDAFHAQSVEELADEHSLADFLAERGVRAGGES